MGGGGQGHQERKRRCLAKEDVRSEQSQGKGERGGARLQKGVLKGVREGTAKITSEGDDEEKLNSVWGGERAQGNSSGEDKKG